MKGLAHLVEVLLLLLGPLIGPAFSAAVGALINAVLAALAILSGIEGLTLAWLVMRTRRDKPAHWLWRPTAWSLVTLLAFCGSAALNVALVVWAIPAQDASMGRVLLAFALPGLISAPFTMTLLVLVGSSALKGLRALRAKAPPPARVLADAVSNADAAKAQVTQAAQSAASRLLGLALVLVGQVLAAVTVLWIVGMLAALLASLTDAKPETASELVQGLLFVVISTAIFGGGAVGLLRLGRPGGGLRPLPTSPAPATAPAPAPTPANLPPVSAP